MLGLSESHQDSLGQRIAATVVVVDAVVGDLFSNLTPNRAQHYHRPCKAEYPLLGALLHLASYEKRILIITHSSSGGNE